MSKESVKWVVNDLGELGVYVNGRYFFLYKGDNIKYGADTDTVCDGVALHDDGTPMMVRPVGKREFGETCMSGLSDGDPGDADWRPLPAAPQDAEHRR
jgi:hypothetical protein